MKINLNVIAAVALCGAVSAQGASPANEPTSESRDSEALDQKPEHYPRSWGVGLLSYYQPHLATLKPWEWALAKSYMIAPPPAESVVYLHFTPPLDGEQDPGVCLFQHYSRVNPKSYNDSYGPPEHKAYLEDIWERHHPQLKRMEGSLFQLNGTEFMKNLKAVKNQLWQWSIGHFGLSTVLGTSIAFLWPTHALLCGFNATTTIKWGRRCLSWGATASSFQWARKELKTTTHGTLLLDMGSIVHEEPSDDTQKGPGSVAEVIEWAAEKTPSHTSGRMCPQFMGRPPFTPRIKTPSEAQEGVGIPGFPGAVPLPQTL